MTRPPDEPVVRVTVTRTGGFAGLRREWRAEPAPEDAPRWVTLIEECPWDAVATPGPPLGADLFVWHVRASCETAAEKVEREAELQDPQVQGAWQELIAAVRAPSAPAPGRGRGQGVSPAAPSAD